jgi:hypothetical protein
MSEIQSFPPYSPSCTVCIAHAEGVRGPCYNHSPERAEERSRNNTRAAKSKGFGRLRTIDKELRDLANEIRSGKMERGTAAVLNQILNTRLRLVEIERKIQEQEEIIPALERLESERKARVW